MEKKELLEKIESPDITYGEVKLLIESSSKKYGILRKEILRTLNMKTLTLEDLISWINSLPDNIDDVPEIVKRMKSLNKDKIADFNFNLNPYSTTDRKKKLQEENKIKNLEARQPHEENKVTRKPTYYKVGDVLMHWGFKHPFILLKSNESDWICTLFTSNDKCAAILEPSKSRFFTKGYFTKVLFTTPKEKVDGNFLGIYDNPEHLEEVYKKLIEVCV